MLRLNKIGFEEGGKQITYRYSASAGVEKFLNRKKTFYAKYGVDVSGVPESIAVIPFLANWLPIAWFAGFDIEVNELDEDFYQAMENVKQEFSKQFPTYRLTGSLTAKKTVKNHIKGNKTAMLFSGGVDAYATYIRVYDQNPDLVTIFGADIALEDTVQWKDFTNFIETETLLDRNNKEYIETNVRDFYTYQVELLLKDIGWWGKVQHGLSLIGSLAPLSFVKNYGSIYIASSYTEHVAIAWGSTPEIDERITWAAVKVNHDGYELKRQDKVDLITQFSTNTDTKFKLRVCYSELRTQFNCSNCEKCFRTILGIILNDKNPNDYGFHVDDTIYDKIFQSLGQGGSSQGLRYFWWELMEKAKSTDDFFVFSNKEAETKEMDRIRNGELQSQLERNVNSNNRLKQRLLFIIRNKFPWLPGLYKKILVRK